MLRWNQRIQRVFFFRTLVGLSSVQAILKRHSSLLALLGPLLLSWESKHHGHHRGHLTGGLSTGLSLLLLPHVELHHLLLVVSKLLLLHEDDLLVIRVLLFRGHIASGHRHSWCLHHRHHGHHLRECCNWGDALCNLRSLRLSRLFCLLLVFLGLLGCLLLLR